MGRFFSKKKHGFNWGNGLAVVTWLVSLTCRPMSSPVFKQSFSAFNESKVVAVSLQVVYLTKFDKNSFTALLQIPGMKNIGDSSLHKGWPAIYPSLKHRGTTFTSFASVFSARTAPRTVFSASRRFSWSHVRWQRCYPPGNEKTYSTFEKGKSYSKIAIWGAILIPQDRYLLKKKQILDKLNISAPVVQKSAPQAFGWDEAPQDRGQIDTFRQVMTESFRDEIYNKLSNDSQLVADLHCGICPFRSKCTSKTWELGRNCQTMWRGWCFQASRL